MRVFTLLFFVCFQTFSQAPQGLNYQSVIRDNSGSILMNTTISVQFQIRQTNATGTVVYTETHSPTTNAYGIFNVTIGQGTTSDTFSSIDWSNDSYFLEVSVDSTGGTTYSSLGVMQFLSVPYAINALRADNVFSGNYNDLTNQPTITTPSGLENIDEGSGYGLVKVGRIAANYGNIGLNATDLSYSDIASTTRGATGTASFTSGQFTTASGLFSTAMGYTTNATNTGATALGYFTNANGLYSLASGFSAIASGTSSVALGVNATASQYTSVAIGLNTRALNIGAASIGGFQSIANGSYAFVSGIENTASHNVTAFGRYNVGGGDNDNWIATDPLFELGNGVDTANRSNALTILKNGTVIAPSFDIVEITDNKALITKEYADSNYILSLESQTSATFEPDWNDFGSGYEPVTFYMDRQRVFIDGFAMKNTSINNGDVIFVLPPSHRPNNIIVGTGQQLDNTLRIEIHPDGSVVVFDSTGSSTGDFINLSGISFRVN